MTSDGDLCCLKHEFDFDLVVGKLDAIRLGTVENTCIQERRDVPVHCLDIGFAPVFIGPRHHAEHGATVRFPLSLPIFAAED